MTDQQIIEIVQAHIDGKPIEICTKGQGKDEKWYDIVNPKWDFQHCDYRVKQEPRKPREWWVEVPVDGSIGRLFQFHAQLTQGGGELVRVREVLE